MVYTTVSQSQHYWHFGLDKCLLRGYSSHWSMFSSIPGLCSLFDASRIPLSPFVTVITSPDTAKCVLEQKCPQLRTTDVHTSFSHDGDMYGHGVARDRPRQKWEIFFFCKRSNSKYFRLSFCHNYSILPLYHGSSHRQCINKHIPMKCLL